MLTKYFLVFLSMLSWSAFASSSIDLLYSDLKFEIPGGFTVVGSVGDEQNILIFKYGDKPGERFLAFSDMTDEQDIDYGCPASTFFKDVFFDHEESGCNQSHIKLVQEAFIKEQQIETWTVHDYQIAYSGGSDKSFIFIIKGNDKLVKIDSDFLDISAMKAILRNL